MMIFHRFCVGIILLLSLSVLLCLKWNWILDYYSSSNVVDFYHYLLALGPLLHFETLSKQEVVTVTRRHYIPTNRILSNNITNIDDNNDNTDNNSNSPYYGIDDDNVNDVLCRITILYSIVEVTATPLTTTRSSSLSNANNMNYNYNNGEIKTSTGIDVANKGMSSESTICCIPIINNIETDDMIPISFIPQEIMNAHSIDIRKGRLILVITNATIITDNAIKTKMIQITNNTKYQVYMDNILHTRSVIKNELILKPIMTILFVRISTIDSSPSYTSKQLLDIHTAPEPAINFINQFKSCAFGKNQFQIATNIKTNPNYNTSFIQHNGVIEVNLKTSIYSYKEGTDIINDAQEYIIDVLNINTISTYADRIIFCSPPGITGWAASAGVRHWRIQMNNEWCTSLTGLLHELGHTMGLLHSRSAMNTNDPYGDRIGYMGSGYTNQIWPRKCYNAYNLYMFQWYIDRHYNIQNVLLTGNHIVNLVSFTDYNIITAKDQYVIINIDNMYYINYNRAKKFNIDTEHRKNEVTIIEPIDSGTNNLIGLIPGSDNTYTIMNYKNSGKKLVIEACIDITNKNNKKNSDIVDVVIVSIALDRSECKSIIEDIEQQEQEQNSINKKEAPSRDITNKDMTKSSSNAIRPPSTKPRIPPPTTKSPSIPFRIKPTIVSTPTTDQEAFLAKLKEMLLRSNTGTTTSYGTTKTNIKSSP